MRFGKIAYLNLLPFDSFIKSYPLPSQVKTFITLKKSYPAKLNNDFFFRRIDAGFISSIAGMKSHYKKRVAPSGIIAKGAVWSVILKCGEGFDYQSSTSNALSQVLDLRGEVLIGDRALAYKKSGGEYIDMGEVWWERERLPFVFGRLCFSKHKELLLRISKAYNAKTRSKRKKIPRYQLLNAQSTSGIESAYILEYLEHIFYEIGAKERAGLERFYRFVRLKRLFLKRSFRI